MFKSVPQQWLHYCKNDFVRFVIREISFDFVIFEQSDVHGSKKVAGFDSNFNLSLDERVDGCCLSLNVTLQ